MRFGLFFLIMLIGLNALSQSKQEKCFSTKLYNTMSVYDLKNEKYNLVSDTIMPWEVCFSDLKKIYVQDTITKNYVQFNIIYDWQKNKKYNYEVLDANKDTLYISVHNDELGFYFDVEYPKKLIRYYSKN